MRNAKKSKYIDRYDKETEKLMQRIEPNTDIRITVFNNNENWHNIVAVLTIAGPVHRRVLHFTTMGILMAIDKKVKGYAKYEKIYCENKKIKIGAGEIEYEFENFEEFKKLIEEIKKITSQRTVYSDLAKDIKDKITR